MAFVAGKNTTISLDGTALTTYANSVGFDNSQGTSEVTAFGDSDREYIATLKEHGLTVAGSFDATADAAIWAMFDGATIAVSYSPDGGSTTYSGSGFLTNYTVNSSPDEKVAFTGTVQFSGAVSRA